MHHGQAGNTALLPCHTRAGRKWSTIPRSYLARPATLYPEHLVTNENIISFLNKLHPDVEHKEKAFRMIRNSTIKKRHLIIPMEQLEFLGGAGERGYKYQQEARILSTHAAIQAMKNASVEPSDISMIIVASCTGFMMPSLTAHLINALRLPDDIIQLPVA